LKFTQRGSVTINVEILEEQMRQFVQVSVEDTGCGIAEHD